MSSLLHRWLGLFGISLFLLKDCQGLFLRHTKTGKCITVSENTVSGSNKFNKFAAMTDNCLDKKAQFRYSNGELLQNIDKNGTLVSPPAARYKSRWAVYKGQTENEKKFLVNAKHSLKQTAAGSLLFYKRQDGSVCAEPSSRFVLRSTHCDKPKQQFTFGK